MNKKQQQLAIAKVCGWKEVNPPYFTENCACYAKDPNGEYRGGLPDYINDLNAMHEAEKTLSDNRHADFREHLCDITYSKKSNQIDRMMDSARNFISSTAAQRAEAFLKALNLWVE